MTRSYNEGGIYFDDDGNPKRQIPPSRKMKPETIIRQEKQREGKQYIEERHLQTNISFQVAGIIAQSLRITYDDQLRSYFLIEQIIENHLMVLLKYYPQNLPLRLTYISDVPDDIEEEHKRIVQVSLAWIMKEASEAEKKLCSTESCYNQQNI